MLLLSSADHFLIYFSKVLSCMPSEQQTIWNQTFLCTWARSKLFAKVNSRQQKLILFFSNFSLLSLLLYHNWGYKLVILNINSLNRLFFMLLFSSADFFQNKRFLKYCFKNPIKLSNGLDPDQDRHIMSVQTVCKDYQNWATTWDFQQCGMCNQSDHACSLIRAFASCLYILRTLSYWPNIIWSF